MTKKLCVFLAFLGVFFLTNITCFASGTIIAADTVMLECGGVAEVPVRITQNEGICGLKLSVSYDSRLVLTGIQAGDALSNMTMTKPGRLSANPVNIVWDSVEEDSSNGVIAILKFNVPDRQGVYNISLSCSYGDIVDEDLNIVTANVTDGAVKIGTQNSVTVDIADRTVTITGNGEAGCIGIAFYDSRGLVALNVYDSEDQINVQSIPQAEYAKVMWWNDFISMKPVADAENINFN